MGVASPPQEPHGKVGSNLSANELLCSSPWKKGEKKLIVRVTQPGDCPVTWNMFLFIQSRVKIAILLIKASHQKFHVAEYKENKLK